MSRHSVGQNPDGIATTSLRATTAPPRDTETASASVWLIAPIATVVPPPIAGLIGNTRSVDGAPPPSGDALVDQQVAIAARQATLAPVHAWAVTIIRRASRSTGAHVVGRITFAAPDAAAARRVAEAALLARRAEPARQPDSSVWSLGTLQPLDPGAPGTGRYRVTFCLWEAREDRFERRTVHDMEIWATDATTARHIAQLDVQSLPQYIGAWRIQCVARIIDGDLAESDVTGG
jgi:hypothetical protein